MMGLATTTADDDGEPAVAADAPSPTRHLRAPWRPRPFPHAFGGPFASLIPRRWRSRGWYHSCSRVHSRIEAIPQYQD